MLQALLESPRYNDYESTGFVEVEIAISGGLSAIPITFIVSTTEQTATGKERLLCTMYQLVGPLLIGSGVDFDSNPINVTLAAREVITSVNIPVMCDKIIEDSEKFDVILTLANNNHQIRIGRDRSQGLIRDSTGKKYKY